MFYLIAGVPRSGKSQFSKRLATELGITRINFDDFTQVFQDVVPDYGLFMEMDQGLREQKAHTLVVSLIQLYQKRSESLIIEGDNFDLNRFEEYLKLCGNELKMVVFGYDSLTAQEKIQINTETMQDKYCWFEPLEMEAKQRIAQEMIERSKELKSMVERLHSTPAFGHPSKQGKLRKFVRYFERVMGEAFEFCVM
jgi:adenylate kinase family enzyme